MRKSEAGKPARFHAATIRIGFESGATGDGQKHFALAMQLMGRALYLANDRKPPIWRTMIRLRLRAQIWPFDPPAYALENRRPSILGGQRVLTAEFGTLPRVRDGEATSR